MSRRSSVVAFSLNPMTPPSRPVCPARSKRMKEAKKEAEALCNAFRAEKEAAYQASMQKVGGGVKIEP